MTPYYSKDGIVLYCGDNREILPTLGRFDLLLTDPNYGIGYGGKKNSVGGSAGRDKACWKTWETDWDDSPCDTDFIIEMRSKANSQIIWGGNYFELPPSQGWLVWDKMQRDFSLADAELAWTNRDKAIRIFSFSRGAALGEGPRIHPTQKPVALMRWCLQLVPDAKTILDPFAGSGTTLLAAKLEGRQCTGVEISEDYCRIAVERLRQGVLNFGEGE